MIDDEGECRTHGQLHQTDAGVAQLLFLDREADGINKDSAQRAFRELAADEHHGG